MLGLDVASHQGLQRNFAAMRVSIKIGTRRYRMLLRDGTIKYHGGHGEGDG